jgi:sugar phosphate isomerase/epimerase
MDRRSFLKTSLVGVGAVAGGVRIGLPGLADEPAKNNKVAVLKLCSQEWLVPGRNIKEKADKILKWGGCGLEFHGLDARQAEQARKDLEGTGALPAAMCWGSCKGDMVSTDPERRKHGIAEFKKILEGASVLGSTGVIWVPCFNSESKLKPAELDKILFAEILPEIRDQAEKFHTRSLLEPLNKGETFYINRLEQAAAICDKINSPGVCMMGDFYHMSKEESDQDKAFVTGGKWLHHVHLATGKSRILPSQEPHSYVEGFKGLKRIGYQDFCSLECGVKPTKEVVDASGNKKMVRDPDVEIPKAFAFLKQQWEAAVI